MIISSKLWVFSVLPALLFLIYLQLLILLTTLFFLNVYHLGLELLRLLYLAINLTCLIVHFMSTLVVRYIVLINFSMVYLKDLFLGLFSSYSTLLHWAQSYLTHLHFINSMLMILNFLFHSRLLTLPTKSLISNKLYLTSLTGCHQTFFPSILLKLSS